MLIPKHALDRGIVLPLFTEWRIECHWNTANDCLPQEHRSIDSLRDVSSYKLRSTVLNNLLKERLLESRSGPALLWEILFCEGLFQFNSNQIAAMFSSVSITRWIRAAKPDNVKIRDVLKPPNLRRVHLQFFFENVTLSSTSVERWNWWAQFRTCGVGELSALSV